MIKGLIVGHFDNEDLHQLQKYFEANEDLCGQNVDILDKHHIVHY